MEALSVLEAERRNRKKWVDNLRIDQNETTRDLDSQAAKKMVQSLGETITESEKLVREIEFRLDQIFKFVSANAEIIDLGPSLIADVLTVKLTDDPTDNLILLGIERHAASRPGCVKAFVSANAKDFNCPEVRNLLKGVGMRWFSKIADALGWLAVAPET